VILFKESDVGHHLSNITRSTSDVPTFKILFSRSL
jgi:hypothetical protein